MQNDMKRHGNLFEKICDIDNILLAHQNARRGKASYRDVQKIDQNPRYYAEKIREMLLSKKFTTSNYKVFWKDCGTKCRYIYKLPYYPDRIIQHALMQILEPIFIPTLIRDTFQSLKGRGTHDARKRIQKAIQNSDSIYFLKFDIEKFYPSVDNKIMKEIIRRKIKCKNTLWILDDIIDSTKGLPVGNYSSQILGNVYLSCLDHYAKENLGIRHYFRYCDDFVILSNDKNELHSVKNQLFAYISSLNLRIKSNWQISPIEDRGIDFVGWVFRRNFTRLRKRTVKRFAEKTKYVKRNHKRIAPISTISSVASYWGQFKYVAAKRLWKRFVDEELKKKIDIHFTNKNFLRVKVS
jgi:RNA-directed DNA polymerase